MRVIFTHKDWKSLEEGAVTKTTFYGVQKVWFDPSDGLISLLLQSGYIYEHLLEREWEYLVMDDEEDSDYLAVTTDGKPIGYFRG